jgi:hypothetical protein
MKTFELVGMNRAERRVDSQTVSDLKTAIDSKSETNAHHVLASHPLLFEPLMERVGHHGVWFTNKPQIRPPLTNGKSGEIPDLLLAGRGSGGVEWFLVELKSPADTLFSKRSRTFSTAANKGLNQLAEYLIYATKFQGSIREALEIREFANPRGILIIGTEEETSNDQELEQLKDFWCNKLQGAMIISSYTRILKRAQLQLERDRAALPTV